MCGIIGLLLADEDENVSQKQSKQCNARESGRKGWDVGITWDEKIWGDSSMFISMLITCSFAERPLRYATVSYPLFGMK